MARGNQTCKILKEIRRQIAEANDIEFITSECRYRGDCLGIRIMKGKDYSNLRIKLKPIKVK